MTQLPSGAEVPVLGQGTWQMGEDPRHHKEEIAALRQGLDLWMKLIDTAEMYGDGASEELIGEAIEGRRSEVFLTSKVLPQNATRRGMVAACERSLRRLRTDVLDLYLLHWRGEMPQIALAWVLRQDGVIAIPKAADPEHVRENRAALDVQLTREDSAALDVAFPPRREPKPLEMI